MAAEPVHILHFADAHIDIANYGRRDNETGLPLRVLDFLAALDKIVDEAIEKQVDLVLFAGDAYKDRNPQPTFQREWGQRMMRLSKARIPTLLLVGNHDKSPAAGRANTLQEFSTLAVPHIQVAEQIALYGPQELGVPVQVITLPWVNRSKLLTREEATGLGAEDLQEAIEERVTRAVEQQIAAADAELPLILMAHASVSGAKYGSERMVMLGHELILGGKLVSDRRLDYVALGHIHKHQVLSAEGGQPPIVYPGSIERVDFGEARERKGFVLAEVTRGHTAFKFVPLEGRRFIDIEAQTNSADSFMADIMGVLPESENLRGAICRLRLRYPPDWETLLDEKRIYDHFHEAFDLTIRKQLISGSRSRLGDTVDVEALSRRAGRCLRTAW